MTNKRVTSSVSLFFIVFAGFSTPAISQDLNRLLDRSTQLWALRVKADKTRAAEFVERESRANFPMHEGVRAATVEAIEFTSDKTKALVRTKAQSFDARIGNFDQTITEPWIWTGGNWFLDVQWAAEKNPFVMPNQGQPTARTDVFTFQLLDPQVDLGAHVQGETLTGSIRFTAPRADFNGARILGMPSMRLGQAQWIDGSNGTLSFTLDTTLISGDIDQEIDIEATGPAILFEVVTKRAKLKLTGKIQGKVSIVQLEQSPDAQKGRFIELNVRNLSGDPFRIQAVRPVGTNYGLREGLELPLELAPGQSAKLPIRYRSERIEDGEIVVQLSPGVLPQTDLIVRFQSPETVAGLQQTLSRTQLDSLVREATRQAELENIRRQQ